MVTCSMKGCSKLAGVRCPKCNRMYCEECAALFLDFAELAGQIVQLPQAICPQCHYTMFWHPALEAQRAY